MTVEVVGAKKKKYTVELDDRTGKGSLTLTDLKEGMYLSRITSAGGAKATSDAFSVVPRKTSQRVLDLMQGIDNALNSKSMKKALKDLARFGFAR